MILQTPSHVNVESAKRPPTSVIPRNTSSNLLSNEGRGSLGRWQETTTMKIGLDAGPPWPESHLPIEIITQIIHHIAHLSASGHTLWSCCLVSHDWYGVAIPYLYRYPRLVNKNFDLFTRTLCPPINAHVRNVGLEGFVRKLDMGRLAYESTNSLTARLLGRVSSSLEYFVAPPVSFS